jgi:23S rRNA (adenine2503-C2)-methyltransferase
MGCVFCASTLGGRARDLRPSEMLAQVAQTAEASGIPVSNVVLMGVGEPLDNYAAVLRFLRLANDKNGQNIGFRRISLSTCGLADKIERLADEGLPLTLSVSLHSPFDEARSALMPVNKKFPLARLLSAVDYWLEKVGRRVSVEYTLISGVNDGKTDADALLALFRGKLVHINLIPVNAVTERDFQRSAPGAVRDFQRRLEGGGLSVTVRRALGGDVDAACGQLRRRAESRL